MISYRDYLCYKKGSYACGTFSHPYHVDPAMSFQCEHPWGNWMEAEGEKVKITAKSGKEYYVFLCEVCTKQFTVLVEEWEQYVKDRTSE